MELAVSNFRVVSGGLSCLPCVSSLRAGLELSVKGRTTNNPNSNRTNMATQSGTPATS